MFSTHFITTIYRWGWQTRETYNNLVGIILPEILESPNSKAAVEKYGPIDPLTDGTGLSPLPVIYSSDFVESPEVRCRNARKTAGDKTIDKKASSYGARLNQTFAGPEKSVWKVAELAARTMHDEGLSKFQLKESIWRQNRSDRQPNHSLCCS